MNESGLRERCPKCGHYMDATNWCKYCASNRHAAIILSLGCAIPCLGVGTCIWRGLASGWPHNPPDSWGTAGLVSVVAGPALGAVYALWVFVIRKQGGPR